MRYIIETSVKELAWPSGVRVMTSHIVYDMMQIGPSGKGKVIANFFDLEKGVEYTEFLNSKVTHE